MARRKPSAWRAAAGVAILAAAAVAANRLCIVPYRCASVMAPLQERTLRATSVAADSASYLARRNLQILDAREGDCHDDLNWIMLVAANSRMVGDRTRALAEYTRALALHQRPEIYYNRGMTRLEMGDADGAAVDLAVAVAFNPVLMENLDTRTQEMVKAAMAAHRYNPAPF